MRERVMKKLYKSMLFVFILLFSLFGICAFNLKALESDEVIYHIVTTVTENPSNSMMINWHCSRDDAYVLLTDADDANFERAKKIEDGYVREAWSTQGLANASTTSTFSNERYVCTCELQNLQARTTYLYKIVCGEVESKVNSFTTAGLTNTWNFATFTDWQYRRNDITHKLIKQMKEIGANPALMLCTGDLVDVADNEDEYSYIIDNEEFSNFVFASSPGDHEYWGDEAAGHPQWTFPNTFVKLFHFPTNGASDSQGSNYYFYYNNVLFISLDMNNSDVSSGTRIQSQVKWFKETLTRLEGTYQYSVVIMHKSIFGSEKEDSSVAKNLRPLWYPIFQEYNVDLVLSGHDHMYSRTYRLNGLKKSISSNLGTYYLDMGSSGDKRRSPDDSVKTGDNYHEKVIDLNKQNYSCASNITVSEEEMVVTVYNQYKAKVDEFVIKAKRPAKQIEVEDFDQYKFTNAIDLDVKNLGSRIASLKVNYTDSGKYVQNIRVLDGEKELLNKPYNHSATVDYLLRDFENTNLKLELTLTNGQVVEITKAINICNNDDIKLEYLPYEISIKKDDVKEYLIANGYKYDLKVDGNIIKEKQSFDTKIKFTNDYYNSDHDIEIVTYDKDNNLVGKYEVKAEKLPDITLPEESIEMDIDFVMLFNIKYKYKQLLECESDLIEYDKENGSISALKVGEGTARFKVSGTDIYKDINVKITTTKTEEPAKSGCNSKAAFYQLFTYISLVAFAIYCKKKWFK